MSISVSVGEVSAAIAANESQTLCLVGYGSGATPNVQASVTNPGAVYAAVGDGPLCMLGVAVSKLSRRKVILLSPTTSGGSVSAVTETPSGTGPTITVTGTPSYTLASVKVKITKAGAGGTGQFKVALDGYTYDAVLDIPPETAASIIGTVDLSGITLSTLTATTLIVDPDGAGDDTVTFTLPASVADIAVQINTQATGWSALIRAGKYLEIYSGTGGASSSLAVNATSTGDLLLGITGTAAGAAATYLIPHSGVTLGFPATSAYVLDTVYSFSTICPAFSAAQLSTALAALQASGETCGAVILAQQFADAYDARTFANQLGSDLTTMHAVKQYPVGALGVPVHQADNATAETEARAKLAFTGHTNADLLVSFGDVYCDGGGSNTGVSGSFRVPAAWYAAALAATYRYSADIGSGQQDPLTSVFSYVHPDGVTKARDESLATTTMRDQGFAVLETRPQNTTQGPWFAIGVSRASASSKYHQWRVRRVIYRSLDVLLGVLSAFENADLVAKADGTLATFEKKAIESVAKNAIKIDQLDPRPSHVSNARIVVDGAEVFTSTDNLTITADIQPKGQAETITLAVNAVDVIIEEG